MSIARHHPGSPRALAAALALAVVLLGLLSAGHGHGAGPATERLAGDGCQRVSAPASDGDPAPTCPVCALLSGATPLGAAGGFADLGPGLDAGPAVVAQVSRPHGPSSLARSPRGPPVST